MPFTATRHEGGAATMADAYARMSGEVGAVSVHQGCGLTNAATGIGEAAKSRTPMLVLAAEAAGAAVTSNFAWTRRAFARSVGAVAERVHGGQSAVADTVRAYRTAANERRTVVLNLPLDVQAHGGAGDRRAAGAARSPRPAAGPAGRGRRDGPGRAVRRGRGGRSSWPAAAPAAPGPQLRRARRAAGSLLATSAVANGLFHGEPYSLGISGGFASPRRPS